MDVLQPYHEAIKSGNFQQPSPNQSSTILERARTALEREVASILVCGSDPPRRVWLRTSYEEEGSPSAINALESLDAEDLEYITGEDDGGVLVLDDAARYEYADWSQVLYCLPEILDSMTCGPQSPDMRREEVREAKENVEQELEFEEDEEALEEIRESIQQAWVTGFLWVQDEETAETGEVLLVWLDEFGRVVREKRVKSDKLTDWLGMLVGGRDFDIEWWSTADVGEIYEGGAWPS